MKPEKMTDEEMAEAQRARHAGDSSEADWVNEWGDKVFAHIAALAAERDEWHNAWRTSSELGSDASRELDALRVRVQALEAAATAVDAWLYNSGSVPSFTCSGPVLCGRCRGCTTAALHKVVSGSGMTPPTREDVLEAELCDAQSDARKLEAEVVRLQDEVRASNSARDVAFDAAEFARKERDALRERAQALGAESQKHQQVAVHYEQKWRTSESRLAAIRQRARDEEDAMVDRALARFARARNNGLGLEAALMATTIDTANHLLGEDATGAERDDLAAVVDVWSVGMLAKLRANAHKGGPDAWRRDPPWGLFDRVVEELDEMRSAMESGASPSEVMDEAHDVMNMAGMVAESYARHGRTPRHDAPENSEPTTAEAFATVRDSIGLYEHDDVGQKTEARSALSLLEPRMGAVGRAAVLAPHGAHCAFLVSAPAPWKCDCWKTDALTDAPPVFTLEEVRAVVDAIAKEEATAANALRDRCSSDANHTAVQTDNLQANLHAGAADGAVRVLERLAALHSSETPR